MTEKAIFGAGCFWGVEAEFRKVEGVIESSPGTPGAYREPDLRDVCSGATGHAEVIEIEYDSSKVSTRSFWNRFWKDTTRHS